MPEYIVHFERTHPEGPPGITSEGKAPVEAGSQSEARETFFEQFGVEAESQFEIVRIEQR